MLIINNESLSKMRKYQRLVDSRDTNNNAEQLKEYLIEELNNIPLEDC